MARAKSWKDLTNVEFSQKQVVVFKCPDKRNGCCASLLSGNPYTFKNVDKIFNLKAHFSNDSSNLLYLIICPTCGEEYTSQTRVDKAKLRDSVPVYPKHIRQPENQKLKTEEHLRMCGKGTFKIFPLLLMWNCEIDLCRIYERNFIKKYKIKWNNL